MASSSKKRLVKWIVVHGGIALFLASAASAQPYRQPIPNQGPPTRAEAMQILDYGGPRLTFSGSVVYEFPNFDISTEGTPALAGQSNGRQRDTSNENRERITTRVIYKGPNGSWDGSNFFLSPNYNDDYAQSYYWNRFVDEPDRVWTSRKQQPTDDCEDDRSKNFGPWLKYRPESFSTTKSLDTLERMYQDSPNFKYLPTPESHGGYIEPAPIKPVASGKEAPSHKQLLWELDQSQRVSRDWAERQATSTRQMRRMRRNSTAPDPSSPTEPQRMSPEPESTDKKTRNTKP